MTTLSQFISNPPVGVNGVAVSYDGIRANYGQCEQLVCVWWQDAYGFKCPPIPYASQLWTNPTVLASFTQIPVGQEQPGDVAVFGASGSIDSPVAGHTDIVINPTSGGYLGFDSNWGGVKDANGNPSAHQVQHTYNDVLGFLRFKGNSPQGVSDMIPDLGHLDALFQNFIGRPSNAGEQAEYLGPNQPGYSTLIERLNDPKNGEWQTYHQTIALGYETQKGATKLNPGLYTV